MKWMAFYDRYFENKHYFNVMASVSTCLKENLKGRYYLGVKNKRYIFHPTEIIILGHRTQYLVQNETQLRKNQKV